MITFKGTLKDIVRTFENEYILTIHTKVNNLSSDELKSFLDSKNGLKVNISKWYDKRSIDSNNYLWVLIDQIAEKLKSTKEEIYKTYIKRVGVFETLPIKDIAVESFIKKWNSRGLGWVCEILGKSKLPNYTNVVAYYGTSVYDKAEMNRILNEVVLDARELGIQTLEDIELNKLVEEWEKNAKK